jgi:hypothetical protein
MSRPVLIGVELIDVTAKDGTVRRVPDIGAGIRERFVETGPGIYTASVGEHSLTVAQIGRFAGQLWFFGSGSPKILAALAHLGASVKLVAGLTKAQRDAILALGFKPIRRKSDNAIVGILPPVVFAGQDPVSVGLDGQYDENEEYVIA